LWGGGNRFEFAGRDMRFRLRSSKHTKAPAAREEAYPELWDRQPRAFLRVLSAARLVQAHKFVHRAAHVRALIADATPAELVAMLPAPYPPTVELALEEMERRFAPADPDWALLEQLLADERTLARELGQRWLQLTAPLWAFEPERVAAFLTSG